MKRISTILISIILIFSLTACGGGTLSKDTLVVGVSRDMWGFGFLEDASDIPVGMEIQIAGAIAEHLEKEIQYEFVTYENRQQKLADKEVDMVIAAFAPDDRTEQLFDFSDNYYTEYLTLLVTKESKYVGLPDLADKKVGIVTSDDLADKLESAASENLISVEKAEFEDMTAAKAALDSGEIQAIFAKNSILRSFIDETSTLSDDMYDMNDYAIAIRKNDNAFLEKINEVLGELVQQGLLLEFQRYWNLVDAGEYY